ncbi:unnamed protein product, partial [Amoebophrya sp. A120]
SKQRRGVVYPPHSDRVYSPPNVHHDDHDDNFNDHHQPGLPRIFRHSPAMVERGHHEQPFVQPGDADFKFEP